MEWIAWAIAFLTAYLVGSIPFGLLLARSRGVDIRSVGSGNIGASNVGRILGRRLGLLCFALDVLKGLVPTLGTGLALGLIDPALTQRDLLLWLVVMGGPVLGHMFSPWLGFRGGKGVATGLGGLLGLYPLLTLPAAGAFAIWIIVLALFRYIGLASCCAGLSLPFWILLIRGPGDPLAPALLGVTSGLALVVMVKHRGNLVRTVRGSEPKVSWLRLGRRDD